MIIIKKPEQIMLMKKAGKITAEALLVARDAIKPGVSTKEVDTKIRRFIEKCGAVLNVSADLGIYLLGGYAGLNSVARYKERLGRYFTRLSHQHDLFGFLYYNHTEAFLLLFGRATDSKNPFATCLLDTTASKSAFCPLGG